MIKTKTKNLKFIDFCSGIGAGRLGLENNGLSCIGFSEIDNQAEITYRKFFGEEEKNYGDLMKIDTKKLPDFDMMIAGFPCQSFSVIGQRKGMQDKRGQIIYGLIKIMLDKNLKYFILENVKGLTNHDNGNTFKVILKELDKAGYKVFHKVLNSIDYGVPQMRERIYFIGIRKDLVPENFVYLFPERQNRVSVKDFLIDTKELEFDDKKESYETFLRYMKNKYNHGRYDLDDFLTKDYLVIDTRQSDLRLYDNKVPTLRVGRHGILYVKNGKFRKLSGYESLLLQGFPKQLAKKVDGVIEEIHLLKQAGNAMTVNTIGAITRELFKTLEQHEN
ncbi:DNA (cytosine-5-)-methyltransferase [Candidatus Gracilibacteria bacterium]|jgi:DNA (cytosine-5)-methyltransferase 1|nr:DNA (cytosine-5-)-methyltransferase [Candidatus Gracilibacteria bacterium]